MAASTLPQPSYSSRRSPLLADNVVATSQPLAAQAGLEALRAGGNAVDAALACAITLTVVEPTGNGIGSDAFAIIHDGDALHGFNGSGRAPAAWTPEFFRDSDGMPECGWNSVTVPGCVDAWVQISKRFGRLPFARLFDTAIHYARNGWIVPAVIARRWAANAERLGHLKSFRDAFLPAGRPPVAGQRFRLPAMAQTLERIAASGGEDFYRGDLARAMVADCQSAGGVLGIDDLGAHTGFWVDPIGIDYAGVTIHELPPNGQGLATLIALGILDRVGARDTDPDGADGLHLGIEAMKVGLVEARRHVADPDCLDLPPQYFLDPGYLDRRAAGINRRQALRHSATVAAEPGTVYLCSADRDGMMVSFIQSNYEGFGSGIVVPGTGISLQNRGAGFVLDEGHPNRVGPGKRPFHTIIPGFASAAGKPLAAFGVMGGDMQAQGHVQVVRRLFDHGQDAQAALDAPRWFVEADGTVLLEDGFDDEVIDELGRLGHPLVTAAPPMVFGGGQVVRRIGDGYEAGSEPRKDGQAVGF